MAWTPSVALPLLWLAFASCPSPRWRYDWTQSSHGRSSPRAGFWLTVTRPLILMKRYSDEMIDAFRINCRVLTYIDPAVAVRSSAVEHCIVQHACRTLQHVTVSSGTPRARPCTLRVGDRRNCRVRRTGCGQRERFVDNKFVDERICKRQIYPKYDETNEILDEEHGCDEA